MAPKRIVVVDDEEDILELLAYNLKKDGHQVTSAATGERGLALVRSELPDLVVLDLMLPGMDGLEVCRELKADRRTSHIPVVMLTARGEESDIVAGLELGADDYITKPFSPRVLSARIRAVLRRRARQATDDSATVAAHGITVNPSRHEVTVEGSPVALSATEFRILRHLVRHPGWVFTRDQIIVAVHGSDYPVTDRSIDVQIVGLRRKLGPAGGCIETVRGVGYRFRE